MLHKTELLDPKDLLRTSREYEEKAWSDKYEAVQYLTRVFARIHQYIGADIVLAKLDEAQREFIIENTKQAFSLERQLPDKTTSARVFATMMVHSIMLCITHRNLPENELFKVIRSITDTPAADVGGEEDEKPVIKQTTVAQQLLSKLRGSKVEE